MSNFSYFLYEKKLRFSVVSNDALNAFHAKYSKKFSPLYNSSTILKVLNNSDLLEDVNTGVKIKYNYVYYYYVAKYIADNISSKTIKKVIKNMCKKMYIEEYSNIMIFLSHLSNDPLVVNSLLKSAKRLFEEIPIMKLDKDVATFNGIIGNKIYDDSVPLGPDVIEERMKNARLEDEIIQQNKDLMSNKTNSKTNSVALILYALKTIEIIGQVTKKQHGKLKKKKKYKLVKESYLLGLRVLGYIVNIAKQDMNKILIDISNSLKPTKRDQVALKERSNANEYLFLVVTLISIGMIRAITNSIGTKKLNEDYNKIEKEYPYNSILLINYSNRLEHYSRFPHSELKTLAKVSLNNHLMRKILIHLTVNYLYLFPTQKKEKQEIARLLNIPIKEQTLIQKTSRIRRK